jgi:hypothetical protein
MTNNDPTEKPQMRKKKTPPSDGAVVGPTSTRDAILYALISLVSFVCGAAILALLVWKADVLAKFGLLGNVYYVLLLVMGLCAAAFLFGVMRSFATYTGTHLGGKLELSGSIVAAALVVVGGYFFSKPPPTFPLTVYVHGGADHTNTVLRNSGRVFVDLDGDRQGRPIGENGEAYFPAIPDHFRGQKVPIWVEAKGFESTNTNQEQKVDGGSLYLSVRRKSEWIVGHVQDQDGNPISGAELFAAGLSARSDPSGYFELSIPGDKLKPEMDVQATASGYGTKTYKVEPGANELAVSLTHQK